MAKKAAMLFAMVALGISAAEAKSVEYECDDGDQESGYRIRVVELSHEVQELIVLKKARGSADVVEVKKLKRITSDRHGIRYEFNKAGHRLALNKPTPDRDGNWTGTFTLPGKRGAQTVRASCGRVETLTL